MNYVNRFLTYAPLTDTLDVCGGDTVPSYVRVENKHFAPHTKERFRVYVPEDQLERLKADNAKLRKLISELYQCSRQCGCDRCGYRDGCAMFDRMAQLGVEVEE